MPESRLRRGFGAEANRWANELRKDLGLKARDPMCPRKLARCLGVRVILLSDLPDCPERSLLLNREGGHDFSAAVCFDGLVAFIVLNDGNDRKRQASNLAHELAHILLRHPPINPFTPDGNREFSLEHEEEANRLGPTLLLSDDAALHAWKLIANGMHTLNTLSDAWGISREVIQMRINLSGARIRLLRAA